MPRRKKEDWIQRGIKMLTVEGFSFLTIEHMTQALGVTKGSFYHHFESIPQFKLRLLEAWEMDSQSIIQSIEQNSSPSQKLWGLLAEFQKRDPRSEIAIRAWAAADDDARATMMRLDKLRTAYLSNLLTAILGDAKTGKVSALLLYSAVIGSLSMHPPVAVASLKKMFAEFFRRYGLTPGG